MNPFLTVLFNQPECGCSSEGGNVTAPDRCCKKGSQCTSRLDVNARPVQYVNDASALTYWQSAPAGSASEQYTANVTIDLLIQQVRLWHAATNAWKLTTKLDNDNVPTLTTSNLSLFRKFWRWTLTLRVSSRRQ